MSVGWRKLEMRDIKHGVTVRITSMQDTVYNGATIIRVSKEKDSFNKYINLTLARPFAYANAEFESKQPMCGCEVFDMYIKEDFKSDLEVYEGRDGELRSMLTWASKDHD